MVLVHTLYIFMFTFFRNLSDWLCETLISSKYLKLPKVTYCVNPSNLPSLEYSIQNFKWISSESLNLQHKLSIFYIQYTNKQHIQNSITDT